MFEGAKADQPEGSEAKRESDYETIIRARVAKGEITQEEADRMISDMHALEEEETPDREAGQETQG